MRDMPSRRRFSWLDRPLVVALVVALLLLAYVGGVVVVWKIWESGDDDAFQSMQQTGIGEPSAARTSCPLRRSGGTLDT